MHVKCLSLLWACCLGILFIGADTLVGQVVPPDDEGFMIASPSDMVPPEGGRSVLVYGNPSEPGFYVQRITFGPGQGSRPHFHNQARLITVIKGTWYTSYGPGSEVYDPDNMTPVEEGTFIYQPPNGHHYDMAKDEEVTVQIMGIGPVDTTSLESR